MPTETPLATPAALTPDLSRRDLAVDLVRVLCVLVVVVAHLLLIGVGVNAEGSLVISKPLAEQPWFAPLSGFGQVMPLFFALGGFAAMTGIRSLRARGGTPAEFVRARLVRLARPSVLVFGFFSAVIVAALALGAPDDIVDAVAAGVGAPLWFLAAFVLCQTAAPLMVRLHERAPWLTLAGLAGAAIAVDLVRAATSFTPVGMVNTAFVWLFVQQLGFFYADGTLAAARRRTVAFAGAAAVAFVVGGVLTGAWGADMLGNQYPPKVVLALIGVAQLCLLVLLHPVLSALMRTRGARALTFLVGSRLMSVYLWHLPAIVAVTGLCLLVPGWTPSPGGAAWWSSRPLVLAGALVLVFLLSLFVARWERGPRALTASEELPSAKRVGVAALLIFLPPVVIMQAGLDARLAVFGLVCYSVALVLCRPQQARRTTPADLVAQSVS